MGSICLSEIKRLTEQGERELAEIPPGTGKKRVSIDFVKELKDFYIRDPVLILVGSLPVHGKGNDIDIVIRGEDFSDELLEAIEFRMLRQISAILDVPYEDIGDYVHFHISDHGSYTDYLNLYRLKLERVPDAEVVRMLQFVRLEEGERWIIAGYASVDIIDREGEEIPLSALKDALERFMAEPKARNIMLEHTSTQIGWVLPEWKGLKTHVDDRGLFIVAEIRKDLESALSTWKKIQKGELNSFSVKVEVLKTRRACKRENQDCWDIIEKCNLVEISVVKLPANPESKFGVVQVK